MLVELGLPLSIPPLCPTKGKVLSSTLSLEQLLEGQVLWRGWVGLGDDDWCLYHECATYRITSMNLQSQYQTFFTGVVVLGAVLLDIYRNKRATEVRILTPSDEYRNAMQIEIATLREQITLAPKQEKGHLRAQLRTLRFEVLHKYRAMRQEEREQANALKRQEKEFEKRDNDRL